MSFPSKYTEEFAIQAQKICRTFGATDQELADFFDVSVRTIINWRAKYPKFQKACMIGKDAADDRVEWSLYQKAVGYSHLDTKMFYDKEDKRVVTEVFTKHHPPDTTACIFWLKNRRKDAWRNNPDNAPQSDHGEILTDDERARQIASLIDKQSRNGS